MTHDPLCPLTKPCVDKHSGRIETHAMCECHVVCMHCEVATCQCSVVKQARADERERATEATRTALADAKWSNAVTVDWANGYIAAMKVALESLRGES
jgi:hypothetical protein